MLVEDEFLVAVEIEELLIGQGAVLVGSCSTLAKALSLARTESMDAALLDVNLNGEQSFEVAELLDQRQIPFLFISGYDECVMPTNRPKWRLLNKPFRAGELVARVEGMLARTPSALVVPERRNPIPSPRF